MSPGYTVNMTSSNRPKFCCLDKNSYKRQWSRKSEQASQQKRADHELWRAVTVPVLSASIQDRHSAAWLSRPRSTSES